MIHQIQSPERGRKAQYIGRNLKTGQMLFYEGSDITNAKPRLILPESELYFSLPEIWQIYCRKAWERNEFSLTGIVVVSPRRCGAGF